jgi:hypothetical protein
MIAENYGRHCLLTSCSYSRDLLCRGCAIHALEVNSSFQFLVAILLYFRVIQNFHMLLATISWEHEEKQWKHCMRPMPYELIYIIYSGTESLWTTWTDKYSPYN